MAPRWWLYSPGWLLPLSSVWQPANIITLCLRTLTLCCYKENDTSEETVVLASGGRPGRFLEVGKYPLLTRPASRASLSNVYLVNL